MESANYSRRDVLDKLGIKPGMAIVFDAGVALLDEALRHRILARVGRAPSVQGEPADVVLACVRNSGEAAEALGLWKPRLKLAGGIWLLSAKCGQTGHVDQRDLIAAGLAAGLVDNKVCSISATVSAMRFVIRRTDR